MSNSITIACAAALVGFAGAARGQYFQYEIGTFDDEQSFAVVQTRDAGSITVGYKKVMTPSGLFRKDFYIVKHDKNGHMQWRRLWGGDEDDVAYSVRETLDGGYLIAGETLSYEASMELVLLRLRPNGAFVWAKAYPHQVAGDTIHWPHPGVHMDLTVNDEPVVTGHFMGHPTLLYTDPNGFPLWHNQYFVPPVGPALESVLAFTDVDVDHNEMTFVASGTIEYAYPDDPNTRRDDATLMKVEPLMGFPMWFWKYDWPFDRDDPDNPNVAEFGHGVDIRPDGFIVSAGKTDFGRPTWDMGVITILTDPGGFPFNMMRYQPIDNDGIMMFGAPGYAAVEFDHRFGTNIITGWVTRPDTMVNNAFLFLTDPVLMPFWSYAYGDQPIGPPPINIWPTWGESVAVADLTCGWIMAGRGEEWPIGQTFLFGDNYLVKTEDNGISGCHERVMHMAPEMPGVEMPLPVEPLFIQGLMELPNTLRAGPGIELQLCFYPTCYTGPCNAADLAPTWGVLDLADINAFINAFLNHLPAADINNDGIWDLQDINQFIQAFLAGCP